MGVRSKNRPTLPTFTQAGQVSNTTPPCNSPGIDFLVEKLRKKPSHASVVTGNDAKIKFGHTKADQTSLEIAQAFPAKQTSRDVPK